MVNVLEAHRELWNLMREYDQYLRMKVVRERQELESPYCSFRANVKMVFRI